MSLLITLNIFHTSSNCLLRFSFFRSSCPEVFCKKGVFKSFEKFTGKHLCQSLFFNKVAALMAASVFWLIIRILLFIDNDCCNRQCCGPARSFDIKILDNNNQEVIHLNRPLRCSECCFPCCLQELEVTSPPGTPVGYVIQK